MTDGRQCVCTCVGGAGVGERNVTEIVKSEMKTRLEGKLIKRRENGTKNVSERMRGEWTM